MITREQVADLREGDVVEIRDERHPGLVTTGPVTRDGGQKFLGPWRLMGHPTNPEQWSLTVVSRAPGPLYVNHPRTEPVPGDVVRDADKPGDVVSWARTVGSQGNHGWGHTGSANSWCYSMPTRLRLLVDGETGQVVP